MTDDIQIATFKADPRERRERREVHRRLVEERHVIATDADLEQTAATARDTLAGLNATNGNHAIDDNEPRHKHLTKADGDLVTRLNDVFDQIEHDQRNAVHVDSFDC